MGRAIIVPDVDFSQSGLGTVTINGVVPVFAIRIKGPVEVEDEATFTVSYYPLSTTQKGVTWSVIDGGSYATINPLTGLLTVASGAGLTGQLVKIKATSVVDSNVFAVFDTSVRESGSYPLPVEGRRLQGFDSAYMIATKYYEGEKIFTSNDTTFFIDFILPSTSTKARSIFGAGVASTTTGQIIHEVLLANGSYRIDDYIMKGGTYPTYSNCVGKRIQYRREGASFTIAINGVTHTGNVGAGVMNTAFDLYLYAFAQHSGGTISVNNIADGLQIYSAKLTKGDEDVFDLYPAEWDGVVGMWDRVSKKLIGPENGGYFSLVDNE